MNLISSIVYDVLDDYIVNASFNRCRAYERNAAIKHLKTLEALGIYNDSIIVFDRDYYSENMFRYYVTHNHYYVMRIKNSIGLAKKVGKKNSDFIWHLEGNTKDHTEDIKIRGISAKLESGEFEYLVTTIFDDSFTITMFRHLYFLRWPVEQKHYELKEHIFETGSQLFNIFYKF